MNEKYWYGISFCFPEGNISDLGKFAMKAALTVSGTPAAGLVSEGIQKIYKPLFGGLPVECVLSITDTYIDIRPKKLATFFADNIEAFRVPGTDISSVDKSFNYIIMHHVLRVYAGSAELKFFINPYSLSVKEIVNNIKRLI